MDDRVALRLSRLPSAAGIMARLAYARAKASGVAIAPLLKDANLTVQQIDDPRMRLRASDQIKFLNLVADALGDESLGFHLAQIPDLREIGLLYYVLASSDVLIDALQRGAHYTALVNEGISQKIVDGKDVRILLNYVGVSRHLDRHQVEFWMTSTVRVCRQLTGLRLLPTHVRFAHLRERRPPEFAEFFGRYCLSAVLPKGVVELLDLSSPTPQIWEATAFARDIYGMPADAVCLTSGEDEGFVLFSTRDSKVYDLDVAQIKDYEGGRVPERWDSFYSLIRWYLS